MKKIEFKGILTISDEDIARFMSENSGLDTWNCLKNLYAEIEDIRFSTKCGIKLISESWYLVNVSELINDGWIKKFAETHDIVDSFYLLVE